MLLQQRAFAVPDSPITRFYGYDIHPLHSVTWRTTLRVRIRLRHKNYCCFIVATIATMWYLHRKRHGDPFSCFPVASERRRYRSAGDALPSFPGIRLWFCFIAIQTEGKLISSATLEAFQHPFPIPSLHKRYRNCSRVSLNSQSVNDSSTRG